MTVVLTTTAQFLYRAPSEKALTLGRLATSDAGYIDGNQMTVNVLIGGILWMDRMIVFHALTKHPSSIGHLIFVSHDWFLPSSRNHV